MSWRELGWAVQQRTGSATRKAVLLALANHTNGTTGRCDPRLGVIADELELSMRAVQKAAAELVQAGLIARERKRHADGSLGGYRYTWPLLPREPGASPPAPDAAGLPAPRSGQESEVDLESEDGSSRANALDSPARVPQKVDRKPVTVNEEQLAIAVLDAWNDRTGQNLRSKDWLAKIVMRIREYPEATLVDHCYLIERNLANPWWKEHRHRA